jgi:Fe-S-cluster-containing hydrogenase component 2
MGILKTKTGKIRPRPVPEFETGVRPVFHCSQEIPCDPCAAVCPQRAIHIDRSDIRRLPDFLGDEMKLSCLGCEKCVSICPGLAISLVDYRQDPELPTVSIPFEFLPDDIREGDTVRVLDAEGESLGDVEVTKVHSPHPPNGTLVVRVRAPKAIAGRIAGIRIQEEKISRPLEKPVRRLADDSIICHCERITVGDIRKLVRQGFRDINAIKAVSRAGMGACGAKDCIPLIHRIFKEEGVTTEERTDQVRRPLFMEVPLGLFAGCEEEEKKSGG